MSNDIFHMVLMTTSNSRLFRVSLNTSSCDRSLELAYTGENVVMMRYFDDNGSTIRFTDLYVCNTSKLPKDKVMNESTSYDSQIYHFFSLYIMSAPLRFS